MLDWDMGVGTTAHSLPAGAGAEAGALFLRFREIMVNK